MADAGQYVVDVTSDGTAPEFPLDVDLRSPWRGRSLPEADPLPTTEAGRFALPFPTARHDAAAVGWVTDGRDVHWTLPAAVRDALAVEPRFAVTGLRVPRRDGRLVVEMTVANEGGRDGTFAARVSLQGFSGGSVVEFPVPTGESRTYTGRPGSILLYAENRGGGVLTVQYPTHEGLTSVERTVSPPEATTEPRP